MQHHDRQVCRHARNLQQGPRIKRLASTEHVTGTASGGNSLQWRLQPHGCPTERWQMVLN